MRTVLFLAAALALSLAGEAGAVATSYLPAEHRVYDFLSRMELQQAVNGVRLGTRPMTRARVAELLVSVKENENSLSPVERDELSCLMDEFAPDIPARNGLVWDDRGPVDRLPAFMGRFAYRNRRNLFSATGEGYSLYLDPVIVRSATVGTLKTAAKDERIYLNSNGFVIRGTAGGHVGFNIDVRDSKEWGSRDYPPVTVTTMPGRGYVCFKGDHAEFDETSAAVTWSNGPFTLMYGRGVNIWGRGKQGTLALSGYASPYEMLKLETEFWRIRYTFVAAELEQYPPIAQFYYHNPSGVYADSVTVAKRMSVHRVETDINDRLTIGLHETVIYGGRWDLSYLNPVMFYKSAEHTNGDHDNAAMGADFHLIVHRSHSVYGELFIDDITTGKLGTSWYGNKFGWQLGTFIVEPFSIDDIDARLEYTHVNPWVYTHGYPINTYSHYGSTLGYPTGPNSDEISIEVRKRFSRRLSMSMSWMQYRHGANPTGINVGGDIGQGWRKGDSTEAHFLDGIVEKVRATGVDVTCEPLWQLLIRAGYRYEDRNGRANHVVRFSFGLNE